MTPAQEKILSQFDSRGLLVIGQDPFKSKTRVILRLISFGLVTRYRHGGYEITEKGKQALAHAKKIRSGAVHG